MSTEKLLKLNFCASADLLKNGYKNHGMALSSELSALLISKNYHVGQMIDSLLFDLDSTYVYQITGGSSISGTPSRKYVNSFNPIREKIKKRKSHIRVFSKYVSADWSVLDLKVTLKSK